MRHAVPSHLLVALSLAAVVTGAPATLAQDGPVTLRFAISDGIGRPSQAAIDTFVEQVSTRSGGSITVEPTYEAGADTPVGFEEGVAGLVERGDMDLGLVASRAWDLAGVTSLQALQAPFLITDDALAAAVAAAPIADDMLAGMAPAGVTGLALWPEELRHPFSYIVEQPFVSPADFAGRTIRILPSGVSRTLFGSLGATVYAGVDTDADIKAGRLHGAESGLLQGQSLPAAAVATGDVVFYPKFQVLVANSAALGRLAHDQQQVLRDAAIATRDSALTAHPSEADAAAAWCTAGGRVVLAGPDGVAAFKAAAQPVLDQMAADPATASLIASIRELAATVEPAAGATACAPVAAVPSTAPGLAGFGGTTLPPDGTYRSETTEEQLVAGGATESYALQNAGVWTMTFDNGMVTVEGDLVDGAHRCTASATIVDDRVRFVTTSPGGPGTCGITYDYLWRMDGDSLYMVVVGSADPGMSALDLANELSWRRIPSRRID